MKLSMVTATAQMAVLILSAGAAAAPPGRGVGGGASVKPAALRCDYQKNPLGMDFHRPLLSWRLKATHANAHDLMQSAYQILAATSRKQLATGHGNLWNSGRVKSARCVGVTYAGRALHSQAPCYWAVRVWGRHGHVSAYSKPAFWRMGLLSPTAWKATWIMRAPASNAHRETLAGCHWWWVGQPTQQYNFPPEMIYLRRTISVPRGVKRADFIIGADNQFTLYVNGHRAGAGLHWRNIEHCDITKFLRPGKNVLAIAARNTGTVPNAAGVVGRLYITRHNGHREHIDVNARWRGSLSPTPGWKRAGFGAKARHAKWVKPRAMAPFGAGPWQVVQIPLPSRPMPIFRKQFALKSPVKNAQLYICGLGQFAAFINGQSVGRSVLNPGWTKYNKVCLYRAYDVTKLLRKGPNAIGVMLGNGVYHNLATNRYTHNPRSYGPDKLISQLVVHYRNGKTAVINSNGSWLVRAGPITYSNPYGGEDYNALRYEKGWDRAGFKAVGWRRVLTTNGPGGKLECVRHAAPPIRVVRVFKAVRAKELSPSSWVYNLGQNFSMLPQVTVSGKAGQTVQLWPGEWITASGAPGSPAEPVYFKYTLNGQPNETWHARFTYFGSQYIEIKGAVPEGQANPSHLPVVQSVGGLFVTSSEPVDGHFACSNTLFNKTDKLIRWAIRNNSESIMTDCPTREKTGWLEEDHLMGPSMMYNFGLPVLFQKISGDMADSQLPNGLEPDYAPTYVVFGGGFFNSPEWGSSSVLAPWQTYRWYGDITLLRQRYHMIKGYINYLRSQAHDNILSFGLGDWYDIGPNPPGVSQLTPIPLTATAFYYRDLVVGARIARLLHKNGDARRFKALARSVRRSFNQKFYHARTHEYATGSQTANSIPLVFGLAHRADRAAIVQNIVNNVRKHGNSLTAGDVGYKYLLEALAAGGRSNVIFTMNNQSSRPGYGYMLAQGATSLTEAWNASKGSSWDHFMLGHFMQWLYQDLAGISQTPHSIAYKHIVIRPRVVGNITWVKASYRSEYGRIVCHWRRSGSKFKLHIVIPPNTSARVYVPGASASLVREGGEPITGTKGLTGVQMVQPAHRPAGRPVVILHVGSGSYNFSSTLP